MNRMTTWDPRRRKRREETKRVVVALGKGALVNRMTGTKTLRSLTTNTQTPMNPSIVPAST
jgi:hypothetical protein